MNHKESNLLIKDCNTEKDLADYTQFIIDRIIQSDGKSELMSTDDTSALTPEELKEYQDYKKVIDELRSAFAANEQNSVDMDKFDEMKIDLTNFIRSKLASLFGGDVAALPLCYNERAIDANGKSLSKTKSPCDYCRFGDICKNSGKFINVVKEKNWENKYLASTKEK